MFDRVISTIAFRSLFS